MSCWAPFRMLGWLGEMHARLRLMAGVRLNGCCKTAEKGHGSGAAHGCSVGQKKCTQLGVLPDQCYNQRVKSG